MTREVQYLVTPMARACLVQFRVPLAIEACTREEQLRLDRAFEEARTLLEHVRDAIARAIAVRGVCPYCHAARHAGEDCP